MTGKRKAESSRTAACAAPLKGKGVSSAAQGMAGEHESRALAPEHPITGIRCHDARKRCRPRPHGGVRVSVPMNFGASAAPMPW